MAAVFEQHLFFKVVTPASMYAFLATEDKRRLDPVGSLLGSWLPFWGQQWHETKFIHDQLQKQWKLTLRCVACHRSSSEAQATTQSAETQTILSHDYFMSGVASVRTRN